MVRFSLLALAFAVENTDLVVAAFRPQASGVIRFLPILCYIVVLKPNMIHEVNGEISHL
jgi:hypothetical protein